MIGKQGKRILSAMLALVMLLTGGILSAACSAPQEEYDEAVFALDKTKLELTVDGSTESLALNIANIEETPVWSSSDTSVATVTVGSAANRATVRGVKKGYAVITVEAGEYIAVCAVNVRPAVRLELLTPKLELLVGRTATVSVDTDLTVLDYRSDRPSVATVNKNGLVTAISGGTANITVSGGNKSVVCPVTVIAPYVVISDMTVQLTTEQGKNKHKLTAESNGSVEWSTSDPDVATVSSDGMVTAVGVGTAEISARYGSAEDYCIVKVKNELLTVELSESSHSLEPGGSFTLSATVGPDKTGEDAEVTWSVVSGNNIVAVSADGAVTSLSDRIYGTATVRATSVLDPDAYAECEVTVPDPLGDWLRISDKASLESALKSGNENVNMYLTRDIDLGGATINSTLGTYMGTIDGRGFCISNFKCGKLMNILGIGAVIKELAIKVDLSPMESNNGLFGLEIQGTLQNCLFEATFGKAQHTGVIARSCSSYAKVINCVLLTGNPSSTSYVYAGIVQGATGTWKNVFYSYSGGSVISGGATQKSEAQLKQASLYTDFDEDLWIIEDGKLPELYNADRTEVRIALDKKSHSLYVGQDVTLSATVKPATASEGERAVVWTSSDPTVATVTDGVVTAIKAGSAVITAATGVSGVRATCAITVNAVTVDIDGKAGVPRALRTGSTLQLSATANAGEYEWLSSEDSILSVTTNGFVTAESAGTATVTVRSLLDPDSTDSVTITVSDTVDISVSLDRSELALDRDDTAKLTVTVTNSGEGVTWSSSDETVATVDQNGNVTSLGTDGTAVITATANDDGGKGSYETAECTVTVTFVPVVISTPAGTTVTLTEGDNVQLSSLVTVNKGSYTIAAESGDDCVTISGGRLTAAAPGTVVLRVTSDVDYTDHPAEQVDITVTVEERTILEIVLGNASGYNDWWFQIGFVDKKGLTKSDIDKVEVQVDGSGSWRSVGYNWFDEVQGNFLQVMAAPSAGSYAHDYELRFYKGGVVVATASFTYK